MSVDNEGRWFIHFILAFLKGPKGTSTWQGGKLLSLWTELWWKISLFTLKVSVLLNPIRQILPVRCPLPTRQWFVANKSSRKDAFKARFTSSTRAMVKFSKGNQSTFQKRVFKNRAFLQNQFDYVASIFQGQLFSTTENAACGILSSESSVLVRGASRAICRGWLTVLLSRA